MHILYLHQHFAVPSGTTGTRSYEFARRWVKAGHKVTVITGHYDIGGLEMGKGGTQHQNIEGIDVIIVGTKYGHKMPFWKRIYSFIAFIFFSIVAALKVKGVDVIFATSTPLTIGIPAMILKFLKRVPYVFEVRDEWPRIPIEMGLIRNRFLIKFLLALERMIYRKSSAIVALSPGMAQGVRSVIGDSKPITIVSNSSDLETFTPNVDGSIIRSDRGWHDKFVLLHFGAMGKANGLDFVVKVADRLRNESQIKFILIGSGSERDEIAKQTQNLHLSNIEIIPPQPKKVLPEYVAACDVSMVIFASYPILEHNSANKFFDSLSAGKPILLNYSGWQREIIEKRDAGLGCSLCDLDEYCDKIMHLYSHKDKLHEMGQNARKIALEQFDRDKLAGRVLQLFSSIPMKRK